MHLVEFPIYPISFSTQKRSYQSGLPRSKAQYLRSRMRVDRRERSAREVSTVDFRSLCRVGEILFARDPEDPESLLPLDLIADEVVTSTDAFC